MSDRRVGRSLTRTEIRTEERGVLIKLGSRLRSAVCTTEVIVVRDVGDVVLECGGRAMTSIADAAAVQTAPDPRFLAGTQLGKRYLSESSGLEVMCTKPGAGSLSVNGEALVVQESKALPSSD
jgi:hypothetical protein